MEATELMVGDIVRVNKNVSVQKGTIVEIRGIDADNAFLKRNLKGSVDCVPYGEFDITYGVWVKHLDPIPITEEFIKNNFEKKTLYGIFDDYFDFEIREFSDGIYVVNYHNCEMHTPDKQVDVCYIHELQHFFKMCGIERKLKV